ELGRYLEWLRSERALDFAGYEEVWRWSVSDLEAFWASIWDFYEVRAHTPYEGVLGSREMPGAEWFPGARLNYAEHMLGRDEDADAVAVVAYSQTRDRIELTFGALREQAARARLGPAARRRPPPPPPPGAERGAPRGAGGGRAGAGKARPPATGDRPGRPRR